MLSREESRPSVSEYFSVHNRLTLAVQNPCRERTATRDLNPRASEFLFVSYLMLEHIRLIWSPLTEEVILHTVFQLKEGLDIRYNTDSYINLIWVYSQSPPDSTDGKTDKNQPAFCFLGLKCYMSCKEMRADISETHTRSHQQIQQMLE